MNVKYDWKKYLHVACMELLEICVHTYIIIEYEKHLKEPFHEACMELIGRMCIIYLFNNHIQIWSMTNGNTFM